MLWLLVLLHREGMGLWSWCCWLLNNLFTLTCRLWHKRLYYFKTVHYPIWNGSSHHHPAGIATLYLGFREFSTQMNAALSLGSQAARNLSVDGRMGVNAGEGDVVWQNAHNRGVSPSLAPTDLSIYPEKMAKAKEAQSPEKASRSWQMHHGLVSSPLLRQTVAMEKKLSVRYL